MGKLSECILARVPGGAKQRVKRSSMGCGGIAVCVALMLAHLPDIALAEEPYPGIHVTIEDIRNSTGKVACALFESPDGFPREFVKSATHIAMQEIRETRARCHFLGIPSGTYALAVIHDENLDGELATNWLGVPTEGYGFSNDVTATLSAPAFEDARFAYDGQKLDMTITLNY